ncbi:hypothetical protein Tdes44962_MAKER06630 [Teratosphaeria destructans]|uniref:F-box domain-containing protein n=1 Tax=Teratosphaeria destructans TaxID=418781 RepID=A0A9W7T1R9_9PEZI|nr:hypothetical protein Tdes44962_MAKER06630 [Teratosphaeria destructans]
MAHAHNEDVSTRVTTDPTGSSVDNVVRPAETIKQAPDSTQAAAPRDKPFRFLDLPRELRDKIYALVKCPLVGFTCSKNDDYLYIPWLRCPAFCASPLLLISRAFKQEYEEEVYRTAVFTITIPSHFQPQDCQLNHESVRILEKARTVVAELEITSIYGGGSAFDAGTSSAPGVRCNTDNISRDCPSRS